jgi:uncharacterized protein with HEPN domain
MQPKALKLIEDIRAEAEFIVRETAGESFDSYLGDARLRKAIERSFEIIGEAANRLSRLDPEVAARISAHAEIIAFRNVLIHGYDVLDQKRIWKIVQEFVPTLLSEAKALLGEDGEGAKQAGEGT